MDNDIKTTGISNDEIELLDLLKVLIEKKSNIAIFTAFISTISVIYSLLLPNIYESKALLAPNEYSNTQSSVSQSYGALANITGIKLPSQQTESNYLKAIQKLNSLSFFESNILPNIFLPDLMAIKSWDRQSNIILYDDEIYNESSNEWVRGYTFPQTAIPSAQESFEVFRSKHLSLIEDNKTGFISIQIKHQSPYIAKEWNELLVKEINTFYRSKDKETAQKAVNYLSNEITKINLAEIKQVVSTLLQQQMQKLTLVEVNEYYVFEFIDPPAVMEKKSEPKRFQIVIMGFLIGIFLSSLLVITNHYFFKKFKS